MAFYFAAKIFEVDLFLLRIKVSKPILVFSTKIEKNKRKEEVLPLLTTLCNLILFIWRASFKIGSYIS